MDLARTKLRQLAPGKKKHCDSILRNNDEGLAVLWLTECLCLAHISPEIYGVASGKQARPVVFFIHWRIHWPPKLGANSCCNRFKELLFTLASQARGQQLLHQKLRQYTGGGAFGTTSGISSLPTSRRSESQPLPLPLPLPGASDTLAGASSALITLGVWRSTGVVFP